MKRAVKRRSHLSLFLFVLVACAGLVGCGDDNPKTISDGDAETESVAENESAESNSETEAEHAPATLSVPLGFIHSDLSDRGCKKKYSDAYGIDGVVTSHEAIAVPDTGWPTARRLTLDTSKNTACARGLVTLTYSFPDDYRIPAEVGESIGIQTFMGGGGSTLTLIWRASTPLLSYGDSLCFAANWIPIPIRSGIILLDGLFVRLGTRNQPLGTGEALFVQPQSSSDPICSRDFALIADTAAAPTLSTALEGQSQAVGVKGRRYRFVNYLAQHHCEPKNWEDCSMGSESDCADKSNEPGGACYVYRLSREE